MPSESGRIHDEAERQQVRRHIEQTAFSNHTQIALADNNPEAIFLCALGRFFDANVQFFAQLQGQQAVPVPAPCAPAPFAEKTVLFLTPNGVSFVQDLSIYRMARGLRQQGWNTVLLCFSGALRQFGDAFTQIHETGSVLDFFRMLQMLPRSHLLYRGWMTAYLFGAYLVRCYPETVVMLKDWNFAEEKDYLFLISGNKPAYDFWGIDYIFRNCRRVLSQYAEEEGKLWAAEYNTNPDKFIFFPELCTESSFVEKSAVTYDKTRLVHAGSCPPTSMPEGYFPSKKIFEDAIRLTRTGIDFSYVIQEKIYDAIISNRDTYFDMVYENYRNPDFHLVKGRSLDPGVLLPYHFGIFCLTETVNAIRLIKHSIPSKFAFYLEAGLPMLVNKRMTSLAAMVEERGLGITFTNDDVPRLDQLLDIGEKRYNELVKNVCAFRKRFTYESFDLVGILG